MPMQIEVLVLNGVLDSALAVTRDVIFAANRIARVLAREPPFAQLTMVSPTAEVVTGTGLLFRPDRVLHGRDRKRSDALIVLGVNAPTREELNAMLARVDAQTAIALIRRYYAKAVPIVSSCSGTFLCASAGVLDGKCAITTWWLTPHFRALFPNVILDETQMVVEAPGITTSGAAMSQVDLMLWFVRKTAGPQIADLCARYLVVDERRSQSPYLVRSHVQHTSEEVLRAEAFARKRLRHPISVQDLARAAKTSMRTLSRRFHETLGLSPVRFLQKLRAEEALNLRRNTRLSLEQIAERVGYADAGSVRRVWQAEKLQHTR
jgi:transcriptional regulator GlxA family with amidase domain